MSYLIIGKNGNLGRELMQVYQDQPVVGWDRGEIDITNRDEVINKVTNLAPTVVYNCAAYTNVDAAETDYEAAELLNGKAPGYLAEACASIGATLIHYSTGMVFAGDDPNGYTEDSKPQPVNAYGRSKLVGEQTIAANLSNYYLIRSEWLYAKPDSENGKKSFNEIMLELAHTKPALQAVEDEVGKPTWARDLAKASRNLVESKQPFGIYHIANEGKASRYDWTKELLSLKDITTPVEAVSGSTFPRPASRPHYELLTNTKLPPLRTWREALREYLTT